MIDDLTRSILEQRDNIENQRKREIKSNEESYIKQLEQENKQLKEVIEEVREYIKECSSREISLDILEILDKVKVD